jgi:hypothetical protein
MHLQGVSTLLWTTNAKLVGCVYLCASLCYGISGLLMSWVMRGELAGLGEQLLFGDHQLYNTLTTSCGVSPLAMVSCAPPVEVPEPRGLSVLWYSLLVVGMRILHHTSPGRVTSTYRVHYLITGHPVLWHSILVMSVGGVHLEASLPSPASWVVSYRYL